MSDFEKGRTWAEMDADLASSDQDYDSAIGWDPNKEEVERLLAEEKKKFPKAYSPKPKMLYILPVQEFIESGVQWGPMKQLFGPFWLQGEVSVLYSTPGVGKSALAVQIAESLARGSAMAPFDPVQPGCEVPPLRVLYIDFELTRQQFAQRYTTVNDDGLSRGNAYQFSPNLMRAELFWDGRLIDGYEDFTDMLFANIDRRVEEHEAEVLICDNITFLTQSSTVNSSIAFRLMNRLQELKKQRSISVLAIAHTTKHADQHVLDENSLQGSIDIAKVADSMFTLGRSGIGSDIRYLKQVKTRTGFVEHGEDNVVVYRLGKFDLAAQLRPGGGDVRADNFLGLDFLGLDTERNHVFARPLLPRKPKKGKLDDRRVEYAKQLSAKGLTSAEIAKRLGIGKTTAYRYVTGRKAQNNGGQRERST